MDLDLVEMDVVSTFLHGDFHEEIYMKEKLEKEAKSTWYVSSRKACMV